MLGREGANGRTTKYIIRYRGSGPKPLAMLDLIRAHPSTRILDEESPRMLLVEGPESLTKLFEGKPNWSVTRLRSARRLPRAG